MTFKWENYPELDPDSIPDQEELLKIIKEAADKLIIEGDTPPGTPPVWHSLRRDGFCDACFRRPIHMGLNTSGPKPGDPLFYFRWGYW